MLDQELKFLVFSRFPKRFSKDGFWELKKYAQDQDIYQDDEFTIFLIASDDNQKLVFVEDRKPHWLFIESPQENYSNEYKYYRFDLCGMAMPQAGWFCRWYEQITHGAFTEDQHLSRIHLDSLNWHQNFEAWYIYAEKMNQCLTSAEKLKLNQKISQLTLNMMESK